MSARHRSRRDGRDIARASRRAGLLAILSSIVLLVGQFVALADSSDKPDKPGKPENAATASENADGRGAAVDPEAEAETEAEGEAEVEAETDAEEQGDVDAEADVHAEATASDDDAVSATQRETAQPFQDPGGTNKITICHATHSVNHPYVQITVGREAADGLPDNQPGPDHFGHHDVGVIFNSSMEQGDEWDDIIPPVDDEDVSMGHGGLHWAEGQAILEAGCEFAPTVTTADVGIVKSGPASATVNGSFSYTVTVTNTGTAAATNVTVTDNVSGALTVTAVSFTSPGGNGTCTVQQNVSCNVGTLQAGQSATVTITVTVSVNACPQVVNTASVSADGIPAEASNTVTTTVPCPANVPSLALLKTGTATVTQGGAVTYTVTVSNSGTGSASSVVITDDLNDAFTSVAASSTIGTCSVAAGNVVTCNVGTLNAGQSATITITANAPTGTCPTITNQATGTHSGGTIPASGTVTTTVTGCAGPGPTPEISVRIQKTNDANEDGIFTNNEEAKTEGRDVDFHLVITNTSDETVEIVTLTDAFGQTVLDLLDAECSALAGMQLDPGESVTCTFTLANYSPPENTAIVNVAEVCVEIVGGVQAACDDNPSRVRSAVVLGRTVTPTPPPPPTRTPPGGIAFTGPAAALPLAAAALLLLTLGTGLLWAGRRRGRVSG
jgi:uncharacterized repeat protein (TIGR01451 family)